MITLKDLFDYLLVDKRVAYYDPNFIWIESLGIRVEVLISTGSNREVHYALLVPVGIHHRKVLGNMLIKTIGVCFDQKYIKHTDVLELSSEELDILKEEFNTLFILRT